MTMWWSCSRCIITLLSLLTVTSSGESTDGREFILMFVQNLVTRDDPKIILSTLSENCTVTVNIQSINHTETYIVPAQQTRQIGVPKVVIPTSVGRGKLTIHILSTADISVWGVNDAIATSVGGFLALPTSTLGMQYFVASFEPYIASEVGFVATTDNTTVTLIHVRSYMYKNRLFFSGSPHTIRLNKFETFFITFDVDISGLHITSNSPVAVFAGNVCTFIPYPEQSCEHIVTQLISYERWGKNYVVIPTMLHSQGDWVKVIAGPGETLLTVGRPTHKTEYILEQGQSLLLNMYSDEMFTITATFPVLVAQFSKSHTADNVLWLEPSMILVPAIRQYTDDAAIGVFSSDVISQHYINVVATCYNLGKQYILLDGIPFIFNDTEMYIDDIAYCASRLIVDNSYHRITTTKDGVYFSAVIYDRTNSSFIARAAKKELRQVTCYSTNADGPVIVHDCDDEVVVFTYPCSKQPCTVYEEEELICDDCIEGRKWMNGRRKRH